MRAVRCGEDDAALRQRVEERRVRRGERVVADGVENDEENVRPLRGLRGTEEGEEKTETNPTAHNQ